MCHAECHEDSLSTPERMEQQNLRSVQDDPAGVLLGRVTLVYARKAGRGRWASFPPSRQAFAGIRCFAPSPRPSPSKGEGDVRRNAETVYVFTKIYCGTYSRGEGVEKESGDGGVVRAVSKTLPPGEEGLEEAMGSA